VQAIRTHVAGVDVHRDLLVITALVTQSDATLRQESWECSTFTQDLEHAAQKLLQLGVKDVAMESTGIYWKPVYNVWRRAGLCITLGNAQHIKNVPGRKTDLSDSRWLAELHRCGLIRASYIPDDSYQSLRALTRNRSYLVSDITRVKNRVQKVLEDANIKLKSVLSDVFGVGAIKAIRAIADGESRADALMALIDTDIKAKKEEVLKALTNCLTPTHCLQIRLLLQQYDAQTKTLQTLEYEISQRTAPWRSLLERLDTIPGISATAAEAILAEATADMSGFREDRFFCAWAGVSPGNYQSAKKKRRVRVRHGNPNLRRVLFQAARSAVQRKGTFFCAKYHKLTFQTGSKMKALMAIANRIARIVYLIIKNDDLVFKDIGPNRVDSHEQQIRRRIGQLKKLGVQIHYDSQQQAAVIIA
jgi:transposase